MPVGNGPGASVDTSAMGKEKSIVVGGTFVGATVAIEVSENGTEFQPIHLFSFADKQVIPVAAQFMRVNVLGLSAEPFSATADVGANDNGALFVALPLPAGNGAGASVDVSALGNFTTFVVGGEFRNASISIEISEDGVEFASCGANFSDLGNVQSKVVVANFMRTFVRGRNAFPFTPVVAVGAIIDPIGAVADGSAPNCLIYHPGSGLAGPVVFDAWAGLMAQLGVLRAASNGSGCYIIAVDDSITSPAVIPAAGSPHDLTNVMLTNGKAGKGYTVVDVADGVTFTGLRHIDGTLTLTSLSVAPSVSPVSDFANEDVFRFSNRCFVGVTSAVGNVPLLDYSSLGPGDFASIFIDDGSIVGFGGVVTVLTGPTGTTFQVITTPLSGIIANGIEGPVGVDLFIQGTENSFLDGPYPALLGTLATAKISTIGPEQNLNPVPPATAAVASFGAFFADHIQRFDVSGGAIAQTLPILPVSGGQTGGRGRRITIIEESGTTGLSITAAAGQSINGVIGIVHDVPAGGLITLIGDGESNWYIEGIFDPLGDCSLVVGPFTFPAGGALAIKDLAQVDVSGGVVPLTLPVITAANSGCKIEIKKITGGATAFSVTPAGADTIDGAGGASLFVGALIAVTLKSDGVSNWMVM